MQPVLSSVPSVFRAGVQSVTNRPQLSAAAPSELFIRLALCSKRAGAAWVMGYLPGLAKHPGRWMKHSYPEMSVSFKAGLCRACLVQNSDMIPALGAVPTSPGMKFESRPKSRHRFSTVARTFTSGGQPGGATAALLVAVAVVVGTGVVPLLVVGTGVVPLAVVVGVEPPLPPAPLVLGPEISWYTIQATAANAIKQPRPIFSIF